MLIAHRKGNRYADSRNSVPSNAAVTAEQVKIDAVVGAAAIARTNAERVQRGRRGQLITEARISEENINYGLP